MCTSCCEWPSLFPASPSTTPRSFVPLGSTTPLHFHLLGVLPGGTSSYLSPPLSSFFHFHDALPIPLFVYFIHFYLEPSSLFPFISCFLVPHLFPLSRSPHSLSSFILHWNFSSCFFFLSLLCFILPHSSPPSKKAILLSLLLFLIMNQSGSCSL